MLVKLVFEFTKNYKLIANKIEFNNTQSITNKNHN